MIQSRTAARLFLPALSAVLAPAAGAQDAPFQDPALRWIRPAPVADAWIPTSVGFAGDDELCWSVGRGATPRVGLDATASVGLAAPLYTDTFDAPLAGALEVATTRSRDGLFVLSQSHNGNPAIRDVHLARYDAVAAARGADFAPGWRLDLVFHANLAARVLVDDAGERGVLLMADPALDELYVCGVDLDTGAMVIDHTFDGGALDAATLSADGRRLAVVTGNRLRVFDEWLQPMHDETLFTATPAVAFDADGDRLAVGGFGQVRLLEEQAGAYAESRILTALPGELAKLVDLSGDGAVVAVGWWNHVTGVDARFEVLDGLTGASLRELAFPGTPGGLQNSPSALEVSADGRRVAFGAWGDGDDDPEVVLLDLAEAEPLIAVDLPGSVMALDLDESGTRLLVAAKHLHANQVGTTGELRLYDTGERDLELVEPARPGGVLHLAADAGPATAALFLVGAERATPFGNGLALDRRGLRVLAAPVQDGVAELAIPLPNGPRLPGLHLAVQAAFRDANGLSFSETVLRPSFL